MTTPYSPPRAALASAPHIAKGSIGKGLLLGWVWLIGGYVLMGVIAGIMVSRQTDRAMAQQTIAIWSLFGNLLPWGGVLALLVRYAMRNEMRSLIGVGIAVGSAIALCLIIAMVAFFLVARFGGPP